MPNANYSDTPMPDPGTPTNSTQMDILNQQAQDLHNQIMEVVTGTVPNELLESMHKLMEEYALVHFQRGATMVSLIRKTDEGE